MLMKSKIVKNIHMFKVDYSNAKEFLESIKKQFGINRYTHGHFDY